MKLKVYANEVRAGDKLVTKDQIHVIKSLKYITKNSIEFTTEEEKKLLFGKSVRVFLKGWK